MNWLTVEEIGDDMKVSAETVRRWIRRKALPAFRNGGVWRVRAQDFEAFVGKHMQRSA